VRVISYLQGELGCEVREGAGQARQGLRAGCGARAGLGFDADDEGGSELGAEGIGDGFGFGLSGGAGEAEDELARVGGAGRGDEGRVAGGVAGAQAFDAGVRKGRAELDDVIGVGIGVGEGGDEVEVDGGDAGADEVDGAGGGAGEVDDAVVDEGAAIVDADLDFAMVGGVGDADERAEGEGAMGGGEGVHVVDFAGGGGAAVIGDAVPGGESGIVPIAGNFRVFWRGVRRRRKGSGAMVFAGAAGAGEGEGAERQDGALPHEGEDARRGGRVACAEGLAPGLERVGEGAERAGKSHFFLDFAEGPSL